MEDADAILAYRATSAVEAHALVAYLANAGIESRVLGESLQGAYGGIKLGDMDLPEVWIADKDRASAEQLISAWRAEHHPARSNVKPRCFQFSLALVILGMTYIAIWAGSIVMSESARQIFLPIVNLVVFGALVIVAWKRARARPAEPDEK